MIHELLYTSFEGQGLRKGSGGGFCTVLSTEGMATNLASTLEKLSGYKHPFDIHDPRSIDNPTNYRHAIITLSGNPHYVLSRIADCREEHTGRSNKLAHHVVLSKREIPLGGPTNVFLHPGFCRSDWDRKVEVVPPVAANRLPDRDISPSPCVHWEQATGDAGWAGTIADAVLQAKNNSVNVIVPLRANSLLLAHEVFQLIPSEKRWEITFSTFYSAAIPGSTCNLRFVLDGTPEADKLRRDYRQLKFDLTERLGVPEETARVTAARKSDFSVLTKQKPSSKRAPKVGIPTETNREPELGAQVPELDPLTDPQDTDFSAVGSPEEVHRTSQSRGAVGHRSGPPVPVKSPLKSIVIGLVAAILLVILAGAGAGVAWVVLKGRDTPIDPLIVDPEDPNSSRAESDSNSEGAEDPEKDQQEDKTDDQDSKETDSSADGADNQDDESTVEDSNEGDKSAADLDESTDESDDDALEGLDESTIALPEEELPFLQEEQKRFTTDTSVQNTDPVILMSDIPLEGPIELRIIGLEDLQISIDKSFTELSVESVDENSWSLIMTKETEPTFGPDPISTTWRIGHFRFAESSLTFSWDQAELERCITEEVRRNLANGIGSCVVQLRSAQSEILLALASPRAAMSVQLAPYKQFPRGDPADMTYPDLDSLIMVAELLDASIVFHEAEGFSITGKDYDRGRITMSFEFQGKPYKILQVRYELDRDRKSGLLFSSSRVRLARYADDLQKGPKWSEWRNSWRAIESENEKYLTAIRGGQSGGSRILPEKKGGEAKSNSGEGETDEQDPDVPEDVGPKSPQNPALEITRGQRRLIRRLKKSPLELQISVAHIIRLRDGELNHWFFGSSAN